MSIISVHDNYIPDGDNSETLSRQCMLELLETNGIHYSLVTRMNGVPLGASAFVAIIIHDYKFHIYIYGTEYYKYINPMHNIVDHNYYDYNYINYYMYTI